MRSFEFQKLFISGERVSCSYSVFEIRNTLSCNVIDSTSFFAVLSGFLLPLVNYAVASISLGSVVHCFVFFVFFGKMSVVVQIKFVKTVKTKAILVN